MFRHPVYLAYGIMMVGLTAAAQYAGWTTTRPNEVKNVPRSVRDNPGAYRSVYRSSTRFRHGK